MNREPRADPSLGPDSSPAWMPRLAPEPRRHYLGSWRVDVTDRHGPVPLPGSRAALVRAIGAALEAAGAPRPAAVGLILSTDRELASLNEAHMGHAGPTDVLSFPMLPPDAFPPHPRGGGAKGDRSAAPPERRAPGFVLPGGMRTHVGDIVVSVERAMEQAGEGRGGQSGTVRWAPADELRLLVTHGTLHLCGWDHADLIEGEAMRALERRLLAIG